MGRACGTYGGGVHTGTWVWWGRLRERNDLVNLGVGRKIILKWIFRKQDVGLWAGLMWLRIETSDGLL